MPRTQLDPKLIKTLPNYIRRSIETNGSLEIPTYAINETYLRDGKLDPTLSEMYKVVRAINNMQFDKDDHDKIITQINSSDEALNKQIDDWLSDDAVRYKYEFYYMGDLNIKREELKNLKSIFEGFTKK